MIMERKVYILQDSPSLQQFDGINASRRHAWERQGIDYYPYHAFSSLENWQDGELGNAIKNGNLYVSLVEVDSEVVAHAALVKNKFGIELGRVFSQIGGHGYGIEAVDHVRKYAEALGINQIHIGVSYNRTAMWRAYEETFGQHGWRIAVLGLLPDIYHEHDMQWGELASRAIKDGFMELPNVSNEQLVALQKFALGIQALNRHCVRFENNLRQDKVLLPYQFSENVVALSWYDYKNQDAYLHDGYKPVGIVEINNQWHFIVHKGHLPKRIEGKGVDLQFGRNPVIYPPVVDGVQMNEVMNHIYKSQNI